MEFYPKITEHTKRLIHAAPVFSVCMLHAGCEYIRNQTMANLYVPLCGGGMRNAIYIYNVNLITSSTHLLLRIRAVLAELR